MLENVWFLIVFTIVAVILSTDPKTSIVGGQNVSSAGLFTSASDGKKFFRTITWGLIAAFYILTLLISYYG